MSPTPILGVICIVFVAINAQEKEENFKRCSNHPEGFCLDYTKSTCPKSHHKSYFGCGSREMCCWKSTTTPRPTKSSDIHVSGSSQTTTIRPTKTTQSSGSSQNNGTKTKCWHNSNGFCLDLTKETCPFTHLVTYKGCAHPTKCCYPKHNTPTTKRPTVHSPTPSTATNSSFKPCKDHQDGICIDYTRYKCPDNTLYSYHGCDYGEKCCYPKPSIPTAKPSSGNSSIGSHGKCKYDPSGYCIDYTKERCPYGHDSSYAGCGQYGKCCIPRGTKPTHTSAPVSSGVSHGKCKYDPSGYCIDFTKESCPYGHDSSYRGCGLYGKCCIPRGSKPQPTSTSGSSGGTRKACRNNPNGYCIKYKEGSCPASTTVHYSGCDWDEDCCIPKPTPPATTIRPNVTHTGSMAGGSGTCGKPSVNPDTKIVGGSYTTVERYPWQVLIRKNRRHHCGGSLINERWVLTAAHCIVGHSNLDVVVGLTNKHTFSRSQVRSLAGYKVHQSYRGSNYDIALMKLSKPVDLSSTTTKAVCLPESTDKFDSENCVVSGWGATSEGGYSADQLKHLELPIIGHDLCKFYMKNLRPKVVCAGHVKGGKDACQGDSGGPLVCKGSNGNWIQAGVVSTGIGCARPNLLGLYTEVAEFRGWIEDVIKQNS